MASMAQTNLRFSVAKVQQHLLFFWGGGGQHHLGWFQMDNLQATAGNFVQVWEQFTVGLVELSKNQKHYLETVRERDVLYESLEDT